MSATVSDLNDHLTAHIAEPDLDTPEAETWHIDGDNTAAWAARKAAHYQAEIDRIEALAAEEIDRIRTWAADSTAGARRKVDYFVNELEGYYRRLHAEHGDDLPKTYRVLGADLVRRKAPDTIKVAPDGNDADLHAFIEWALAHDHLDMLVTRPSVSAIKSLVGLTVDAPDLDLDDNGKPAVLGQTSRLIDKATGEVIPGAVYQVGEERYAVKLTGGAS